MNMKCQFTLFCFNIRVLQGPSIIWIQYLPGSLSQVDVVTISCRAVTGLSSIVGPGRQLPQILRQIRIIIDPHAGLEPGASPSQQAKKVKVGIEPECTGLNCGGPATLLQMQLQIL